jgi:hypothetical protein
MAAIFNETMKLFCCRGQIPADAESKDADNDRRGGR